MARKKTKRAAEGAISCACCNTPKALEKMAKDIEREEAGEREAWWWVQFGAGNFHRGSSIVRAKSYLGAIRETHRQKCNPGGIVAAYELPTWLDIEPEWQNKLLDEDAIEAFEETHQPPDLSN